MIKIENFTFRYTDQQHPLLTSINAEWHNPGIIEIAGVSGSGKTTLIHLLNGIIPHIYRGEKSGRIEVSGLDPWNTGLEEISQEVATILQNFEFQLFRNKVDEEVNLSDPLARKLDVLHLKGRRIRELSSGEKQRVLILKNLQKRKRIVLFDEPFSSLDPEGVRQLREIISKIPGLKVVSSHGFHFQNSQKYVISGGKLVKPGGNFKKYGVLVSPYDFRIPSLSPDGIPPVIELSAVKFSYNGHQILNGINLALYPGRIVGISGKNGAGKTTLAGVIAGFLRPSAGKVYFRGKKVRGVLAGNQVGVVFQNPYAQVFGLRVKDEIGLNPMIRENMKLLDLKIKEDAHLLKLSRGELMRLAIASGAIYKIVIFDEPTGGLDYISLTRFVKFLEHLKEKGTAILIFSHNHEFLERVSDIRMELRGGKLYEL